MATNRNRNKRPDTQFDFAKMGLQSQKNDGNEGRHEKFAINPEESPIIIVKGIAGNDRIKAIQKIQHERFVRAQEFFTAEMPTLLLLSYGMQVIDGTRIPREEVYAAWLLEEGEIRTKSFRELFSYCDMPLSSPHDAGAIVLHYGATTYMYIQHVLLSAATINFPWSPEFMDIFAL